MENQSGLQTLSIIHVSGCGYGTYRSDGEAIHGDRNGVAPNEASLPRSNGRSEGEVE